MRAHDPAVSKGGTSHGKCRERRDRQWHAMGTFTEGALAVVRVRCKLLGYLGTLPVIIATLKRPPQKNKNHPQASGIYWQS